MNKQEAAEIAQSFGVDVRYTYGSALFGFAGVIPEASFEGLKNNPEVLAVERDGPVSLRAQTLPDGVDRVQADLNSYANIDGSDDNLDVDIAILDSGVDQDHPDLDVLSVHRCKTNNNFDNHGHGTHVAGIAAAIDNSQGVVGVAPGARIWAVKVTDSSGSGTFSSLICGVDFVTNNASDVEVANMSVGKTGKKSTFETAITNSVQAGVVYVAAVGNANDDVYGSDGTFGTSDDDLPAAYPEVAAVSAIGDFDGYAGGAGPDEDGGGCSGVEDDTFACFTNYSASVVSGNPVNSPGDAIDLAAPGVNVLSTYNDGGTETLSGASMAAPHVAGAAALYIVEHGRDVTGNGVVDEEDVYSIRQALIDAGQTQANWRTGSVGDPDSNPEPLVQASDDGPRQEVITVSISGPSNIRPSATCLWTSSASGGTPPYSYEWLNDGIPVSDSSSYSGGQLSGDTDDSFTLKLSVVDSDNGFGEDSLVVNVDSSAPLCFS